jgi:virulence-associated protein VagC
MATVKEPPITAKLVRHGVYQYIRLPKEFQFEGDQVEIDKYRNGLVIKPPAQDRNFKRPKKAKP